MGLCYSLRPRLFGDAGGGGGSISSTGAASEPEAPVEPHAAPQPQPLSAPLRPGGKPGGEADGPPLLLQNGGGNGAAPERPALPKAGGPGGGGKAARQQALHQPPALQRPWEKLRLEEREAEKEARKVSKSIDRALKEQKREYKQTHRLLLLGTCVCIWMCVYMDVCARRVPERAGAPRGSPTAPPSPASPVFLERPPSLLCLPAAPPPARPCPPARLPPWALPQTGFHLLFPSSSPSSLLPFSGPGFATENAIGACPCEGERLHPGRRGSSGVCPGRAALPWAGAAAIAPRGPPGPGVAIAPEQLGNTKKKTQQKGGKMAMQKDVCSL